MFEEESSGYVGLACKLLTCLVPASGNSRDCQYYKSTQSEETRVEFFFAMAIDALAYVPPIQESDMPFNPKKH